MTPLRRSAALALVLPLLSFAPASATGVAPVTATRLATVELSLAEPDGSSVVQLVVRVADGPEADVVGVQLQRCDAAGCAHPEHYESARAADTAALDAEAAAGQATLELAGRVLRIRWEPDPQPGVVMGSTSGSGSGTSLVAGTYLAEPAVAEVVGGGSACSTAEASVGDALRLAAPADSGGAALPLSSLRLPAGALACLSTT